MDMVLIIVGAGTPVLNFAVVLRATAVLTIGCGAPEWAQPGQSEAPK